MRKRVCKKCGRKFFPTVWNKVYCGSKIRKTGCAWWNADKNRNKRRWKNENYKKYQRDYGKRWKKEQRKLKTDYILRQLESKKVYWRSNHGKQTACEWRRRNSDKILFWNKRRVLMKKSVVGNHAWQEWEEVKAKYNYCCALCGISEKDLVKKWKRTNFIKLTEDHIVPIVRGGTDYIKNIQPLCISCNAKKKDQKN